MSKCTKATTGGKGNLGMFIERDPKVCSAGIRSAQADETVSGALQHYLMKDEVDALLSDTIMPPKVPKPLPPLRHPIPLDNRFSGVYNQMGDLINPPIKTKFQTLVEDFKDTIYSSYWKKPLGTLPDSVPMLPEGLDPLNTKFGRETPFHGRLYDIVMPKVPYPDKTKPSKNPGVQIDRNYCAPPFNPDLTYGARYENLNKQGRYAKCCLTDDNLITGTGDRTVLNSVQADFLEEKTPKIGKSLTPNNNINEVPEGYTFGLLKPPDNLPQCLTTCQINPGKDKFRNCLAHLNSLRKCMSKKFLPTFFRNFYLSLKYFDKEKTGWLAREIVYNYCGTKFIRFDPALIEPLLASWNAFDGSRIEYKTFVLILNFKQPLPYLRKVEDLPPECLEFVTTYQEMVKPNQAPDKSPMAGLPSGRYFDLDYPITPEGYCRASRTCLPHETDMKSCLSPSVMTLLHVSHRDMYAKREPEVVKRIFEATGEKFTDEEFDVIWKEAQKYHSEGWVCFQTFRRALNSVRPSP